MTTKSHRGGESKSLTTSFANSLMDNKQLVHIAAEVVVLVGVVFYFSSKSKKLSGHIEELAQRLEEQEDHMQKQEERIQKLELTLQQMSSALNSVIQKVQENSSGIENLWDSKGSEQKVQDQTLREQELITENQKVQERVSKEQALKQQVLREQVLKKQVPRKPIPKSSLKKPTSPIIEEVRDVQDKEVKFNTNLDQLSSNDSDLDDEIRAELDELAEELTDENENPKFKTNLKKGT